MGAPCLMGRSRGTCTISPSLRAASITSALMSSRSCFSFAAFAATWDAIDSVAGTYAPRLSPPFFPCKQVPSHKVQHLINVTEKRWIANFLKDGSRF